VIRARNGESVPVLILARAREEVSSSRARVAGFLLEVAAVLLEVEVLSFNAVDSKTVAEPEIILGS